MTPSPRRGALATLAVAAVAAVAAMPSVAAAVPALNGTFPTTGKPGQMTLGPDGNIWFAMSDSSDGKEFGRITPAGVVSEFDTPTAFLGLGDVTTGPDNFLWFTANAKLVRVNPATGAAQEFPLAAIMDARGITTGSDGNLWAATGDKALKIGMLLTPAVLDAYTVNGMGARGIAPGSDGRLWIADFGSQRVVAITTGGTATPVPVTAAPQEVAPGPAGQLGYSMPASLFGRVGVNAAVLGDTTMTNTDPFGVVLGDDGAYWTAQFAGNALGRVTPEGVYTQVAMPPASGPRYLARGAGGTLWVGLETGKAIARVTGVDPPAPPAPPPSPTVPAPGAPDTAGPILRSIGLAPRNLAARRPAGARRVTVVSSILMDATEAGKGRFEIQRALAGRRARGGCVAPSRGRGRACVRWVGVGVLRPNVPAGLSRLLFGGRIGTRTLAPGSYRLRASLVDVAGNVGPVRTARFRITR